VRTLLLVLFIEVGCATAPSPKAPDESRRVPVNETVPPDVSGVVGGKKPARVAPTEAPRVEWR